MDLQRRVASCAERLVGKPFQCQGGENRQKWICIWEWKKFPIQDQIVLISKKLEKIIKGLPKK